MNDLEKEIISVLAYFDVFDYPLTTMEIAKWLKSSADFDLIGRALTVLESQAKIRQANGFYFLAGRELTMAERLSRSNLAEAKFKKAVFWAKILSRFPWVRGIAIYSSLSFSNSQASGDLDFFLVSAAGRLWSMRFFINLFLKIFRLRPNHWTSRDKICVSFMADETALDLSITHHAGHDPHYEFTQRNFIFLFGDEAERKFLAANSWLASAWPNGWPYRANLRRKINPPGRGRLVWEKIFGAVPEKTFHTWQWRIMPKILQEKNGQGTDVILSGQMIKMHDRDKRLAVENAYRERMKQYEN